MTYLEARVLYRDNLYQRAGVSFGITLLLSLISTIASMVAFSAEPTAMPETLRFFHVVAIFGGTLSVIWLVFPLRGAIIDLKHYREGKPIG